MKKNTYPTVSILIPTLNSSRTLKLCLDSIAIQNYPSELIEIIFADGGSIDTTLGIIEDFKTKNTDINVKVIENRFKTGEAGKAAALKEAYNEIIAFIDSDNVLDGEEWLQRMVEPFQDAEIIASEPIRYTYRKEDGYITRYCAIMGMNDPLCYFLGNYDRECALSGRWTEMPHEILENNSRYLKLKLYPEKMPTIGANGFLIRKSELDLLNIGDYLIDVDIPAEILAKNPGKSISKVQIGIIHIFAGNMKNFFMKQKRRISDYAHLTKSSMRSYNWDKIRLKGFLFFCFCCIAIIPLLVQAIKGYIKKKDFSWIMHPVFCIVTFYIYAYGTLVGYSVIDRSNWRL